MAQPQKRWSERAETGRNENVMAEAMKAALEKSQFEAGNEPIKEMVHDVLSEQEVAEKGPGKVAENVSRLITHEIGHETAPLSNQIVRAEAQAQDDATRARLSEAGDHARAQAKAEEEPLLYQKDLTLDFLSGMSAADALTEPLTKKDAIARVVSPQEHTAITQELGKGNREEPDMFGEDALPEMPEQAQKVMAKESSVVAPKAPFAKGSKKSILSKIGTPNVPNNEPGGVEIDIGGTETPKAPSEDTEASKPTSEGSRVRTREDEYELAKAIDEVERGKAEKGTSMTPEEQYQMAKLIDEAERRKESDEEQAKTAAQDIENLRKQTDEMLEKVGLKKEFIDPTSVEGGMPIMNDGKGMKAFVEKAGKKIKENAPLAKEVAGGIFATLAKKGVEGSKWFKEEMSGVWETMGEAKDLVKRAAHEYIGDPLRLKYHNFFIEHAALKSADLENNILNLESQIAHEDQKVADTKARIADLRAKGKGVLDPKIFRAMNESILNSEKTKRALENERSVEQRRLQDQLSTLMRYEDSRKKTCESIVNRIDKEIAPVEHELDELAMRREKVVLEKEGLKGTADDLIRTREEMRGLGLTETPEWAKLQTEIEAHEKKIEAIDADLNRVEHGYLSFGTYGGFGGMQRAERVANIYRDYRDQYVREGNAKSAAVAGKSPVFNRPTPGEKKKKAVKTSSSAKAKKGPPKKREDESEEQFFENARSYFTESESNETLEKYDINELVRFWNKHHATDNPETLLTDRALKRVTENAFQRELDIGNEISIQSFVTLIEIYQNEVWAKDTKLDKWNGNFGYTVNEFLRDANNNAGNF